LLESINEKAKLGSPKKWDRFEHESRFVPENKKQKQAMETFNTQLRAVIHDHFEDKKSLAVAELADVLHLNKKALYRRLSGETAFSFEEACLVAQALDVSLDRIAQQSTNRVFCTPHFFNNRERSFYQFLKNVCDQLEQIVQQPNGNLYYATRGLPLFLYLDQPELLAFKLYVWDIGSWNKERIHQSQFSFDLLGEEERELAARIYDLYCQIPTYEIWNNSILESSLEQIQYLRDVQLFDDDQVIHTLAESMYKSIQKARDWSVSGSKDGQADFHLYQIELFNSTNNVLYFESDQTRLVNWTFCDPDHLTSADPVLCDRAWMWLQQLMQQANPVSTHAFRLRSSYFEQLGDYFKFKDEQSVIENE
jgi:transcriptional regulator with XRE-family HTH domain